MKDQEKVIAELVATLQAIVGGCATATGGGNHRLLLMIQDRARAAIDKATK